MATKEKLTRELAEKEVTGWLDLKKIGTEKREIKKDSIEVMVSALVDGSLTIAATGEISQVLKFPTQGDKGEGIGELKYKVRMNAAETQKVMKGAQATDGYAVVISLVAALTGQPKGLIGYLDTEDMSTASAIANFFL